MNQLDEQRRLLKKTLVPTTVAGGGLCGLLVTVVLVETLGPLALTAGAVAGGAAGYHLLQRRNKPKGS